MTDEHERPEGWIEPTVEAEPEPEPEPEPEGEPEPEPEPEAPPAQPAGNAEAEKAWQTAEKASAGYSRKIAGLLDPHAPQLAECPLCLPNLRGYIDTRDVGAVPDEVKDVVQAFLGVTAEAEYVASPVTRECEDCKGLGKVRTGSHVPNWETLPCGKCQGRGYYPPDATPQNGSGPTEQVPALVGAPADTGPPEDKDVWGSPRLLPNGMDNPNFGRMPQYKDAGYP